MKGYKIFRLDFLFQISIALVINAIIIKGLVYSATDTCAEVKIETSRKIQMDKEEILELKEGKYIVKKRNWIERKGKWGFIFNYTKPRDAKDPTWGAGLQIKQNLKGKLGIQLEFKEERWKNAKTKEVCVKTEYESIRVKYISGYVFGGIGNRVLKIEDEGRGNRFFPFIGLGVEWFPLGGEYYYDHKRPNEQDLGDYSTGFEIRYNIGPNIKLKTKKSNLSGFEGAITIYRSFF